MPNPNLSDSIEPRLAIFASGYGSNLQAIIDAHAKGKIPAQLALVVSDKKKAFALERAKKKEIESIWVNPRKFETRETYDEYLVSLLRKHSIDWVVLAGYMKILTPVFVRAFAGKILNIHPSLLPAYPGLHSIERAFEAGDKVGVTVHFVDEGVDSGPVVLQEELSQKSGESLEELTQRVHSVEHRLYPEAIRKVLEGQNS